jgi:chromosome segregation ATPase
LCSLTLLTLTIRVQREIERHGSSGHFELRSSSGLAEAQRKAAEAAAAAREEYRNQLRANKKRIQDSLQNRQSLMERHDKVRLACNQLARLAYCVF